MALTQFYFYRKNNLRLLDDFIQKDYLRNNQNFKLLFKYDSEISASALNKDFYDEIDKLGPFSNDNELPIFLINNVNDIINCYDITITYSLFI